MFGMNQTSSLNALRVAIYRVVLRPFFAELLYQKLVTKIINLLIRTNLTPVFANIVYGMRLGDRQCCRTVRKGKDSYRKSIGQKNQSSFHQTSPSWASNRRFTPTGENPHVYPF